ncbi:MAG: hypothetical protein ACLGHC_03415 [Alphaproteobacteria bacterium]
MIISAPITPAVLILRRFLAVLALLVTSLVLVAPSGASVAHQVDHIPNPVNAGQYHHHASDGSVDVEEREKSDQRDDRSGNVMGHAHPPLCVADPALLGSNALAHPLLGRELQDEWAIRELPTLAWNPHRRPPKTA